MMWTTTRIICGAVLIMLRVGSVKGPPPTVVLLGTGVSDSLVKGLIVPTSHHVNVRSCPSVGEPLFPHRCAAFRKLGVCWGCFYRRETVLLISTCFRCVLRNRLKDGMAFNLSVGLQGVPLSPEERKGSGAKDMETFAMVIAGRSFGRSVG